MYDSIAMKGRWAIVLVILEALHKYGCPGGGRPSAAAAAGTGGNCLFARGRPEAVPARRRPPEVPAILYSGVLEGQCGGDYGA